MQKKPAKTDHVPATKPATAKRDPWIWAIRYQDAQFASVEAADHVLRGLVVHDGCLAGRITASSYKPGFWEVIAFFADPYPSYGGLLIGELSPSEGNALGLPVGCQRVLTKRSIIEDAVVWR